MAKSRQVYTWVNGDAVYSKEEYNNKLIKDISALIYMDLAPWEKEDTTQDEIITTLTDNPIIVVKYLVERFIAEV